MKSSLRHLGQGLRAIALYTRAVQIDGVTSDEPRVYEWNAGPRGKRLDQRTTP